MKEIALIGANGPVMSAVLTSLLERQMAVNVLTLYPERIMLDNSAVTVSRLDVTNGERVREALEGYATVVIANETDLQNDTLDNLVLRYFDTTVQAVRQAGVTKLVVVGSKQSNAFYLSHLERYNEPDWVYFDTEGDFADRVADEVNEPRYHRENASF